MALKPWYKVVTPREDLREGKPLDASEFAVHLDQVRDGRAPTDYQKPERFFDRTYLTQNLLDLSAEVVRRLSGHPDRDVGRLQHGHPVRRRQDALPDPALPSGRATDRGPNDWTGVQRILDKAGRGNRAQGGDGGVRRHRVRFHHRTRRRRRHADPQDALGRDRLSARRRRRRWRSSPSTRSR